MQIRVPHLAQRIVPHNVRHLPAVVVELAAEVVLDEPERRDVVGVGPGVGRVFGGGVGGGVGASPGGGVVL